MTADEILAKLDQVKADIKAWSDQFDKRLNEQAEQIAALDRRLKAVEGKINQEVKQ